ncbi:hypothetical protein FB567DRAFT_174060 [Paraphoma chrysanthemicola]|uniref:Ankyrin repeat protein n=1 Tax=Paraphoma chrysanthemicola TaxID=798071 RepID=A0A8K0W341_9PLEO|nr:hypothetical protein FB567DRAFT_174060 [Paraphoma chrysanthemicola]
MLSCVLPYVDMESEMYLNRYSTSQSDHVKKMHNLISQYEVTSDIHVSRTLDQSYYYMMENTRTRDHDQVVYRYTREQSLKKLSQGKPSENRLLMVNQLWLWKIDEHTILTSLPERWHEGAEPKIMSAILKSRPYLTPKAINWISHVVDQCVNFSEEPNRAGLSERYTKIFARAIATASDAEARYYSSFTEAITKGHIDQTYIDVNIENEIKLLQEIKDIRDELNMLSRVMSDQIDVIAKLSQWASSPHDKFDYGWDVDARRVQIKRMDEDAERVEKSLNHLLDFKQKQINIQEAQQSRKQAEETALQGKFIFVFTIVTVIFTPLSFLAALFAIQIKEFPHDDKGLNLDGSWVGKYMAAGEFTMIGAMCLITLAVWNKDRMVESYRRYQEKQSTRRRRDADESAVPLRSRARADPAALLDLQRSAGTNVSPKETWLESTGFREESGNGPSTLGKRKVNESSV